MPDVWYQLLSKLVAFIYFSRVEVLPTAPRLSGPTLLVALHRNGAVDGWVYKSIFPRVTFLIAAQLRKSLLARLFFTGITVVREKDDGDRSGNASAMRQCQKQLASGGTLAIFPEGTSSLGPRHLPFKSGAARIAHEAWQNNIPLTVLPLGITYNAPAHLRSQVQVVIGTPLTHAADWSLSLTELKRELTARLEQVSINVNSEQYYRDIRALACFAWPDLSYHMALKALEISIPSVLEDGWLKLRAVLETHRLLNPEKAPFSKQSTVITLFAALALTPLVGTAAALNAPPLLAGYVAGRRLPDGPNVITLWRILIGAPVLVSWLVLFLIVALVSRLPVLVFVYFVLSLLGLLAYAPWRLLAQQSVNGLRFPSIRASYFAFRSKLIPELRRRAS